MHAFERIASDRKVLKHAVSDRDAARAGRKPDLKGAVECRAPTGKERSARFAPQPGTSVKARKAALAERARLEAEERAKRTTDARWLADRAVYDAVCARRPV